MAKKTPSLNVDMILGIQKQNSEQVFASEIPNYSSEERDQKYNDYIDKTGKSTVPIDIDLMDDAPVALNKFSRIKNDDPVLYLQFKLSVYNRGVYQPVILWKQQNGRYMILAGHNRRDVCREIIYDYDKGLLKVDNVEEFQREKYQYIQSIVYAYTELDLESAKEIVDDTNILQRRLTRQALLNYIMEGKKRLKQASYGQQGLQELVNNLGLKKSALYENLKIAEKTIPELQDMYCCNYFGKKAALSLSNLDSNVQEVLYSKYKNYLKNSNILRIEKGADIEQAIEQLTHDTSLKKATFNVPLSIYDDFIKMAEDYLKKFD